MTVAVWIVLSAFGVAIFILSGALVELFRSVEQIRERSGASDAPTKIEMQFDTDTLKRAGFGPSILEPERAVILILSDRCTTCDVLAGALGGWAPDNVHVVLHPSSEESAREWLERHGLLEMPNLTVDITDEISDAVGVRVTPSALRITSGRIVAAHTVPSSRRMFEELSWVESGGHDRPPKYQAPSQSYREFVRSTDSSSRSVQQSTETEGSPS